MRPVFILLFTGMALLCLIPATAQSPQIVFDYDQAGNRILRYADSPQPAPVPHTDTAAAPAAPQDTVPATFQIALYPNPVTTDLQVSITVLDDSPQLPATFTVRLVSMQGAVIYRQQHTAINPVHVNMQGCLPGYYQLTVTRGAEIQQLTIIKI